MTRALADILDCDPITLTEASRIVLRGVVSVSALRAEARRGNLAVERIGKNLYTTPAAIREMRELCRVMPNRPDSTSEKTTKPGSSATGEKTSELAALKASVHGMRRTKEYNTWCKIRERCGNQGDKRYADYGGRGIRVCDEWLTDFQPFFDHVGPAPSRDHSIDRIDNNGNYEPGNVRWATRKQQGQNKRNTVKIKHEGRLFTVQELIQRYSAMIPAKVARNRLNSGWSVSRALTQPVHRRRVASSDYTP